METALQNIWCKLRGASFFFLVEMKTFVEVWKNIFLFMSNKVEYFCRQPNIKMCLRIFMYFVTICQESFAQFSWNQWHVKLEIYAPLGMHVFEPHSIASDCSRTRSTYQTLHFKKETKICRATSKDNSKRLAN